MRGSATMSRLLSTLFFVSCASTEATDPHTTVTVEPPRPPALADASPPASESAEVGPIATDLPDRIARFAPVAIDVDESRFGPRTRQMLRKLVEAGQLMHQIALRQVDTQNPALRSRLLPDSRWKDALTYFDMMMGPWDRTDPQQRPFIGTRTRPPGGGFYPTDLGKAELEGWIASHPEDKEAFQSYFTV